MVALHHRVSTEAVDHTSSFDLYQRCSKANWRRGMPIYCQITCRRVFVPAVFQTDDVDDKTFWYRATRRDCSEHITFAYRDRISARFSYTAIHHPASRMPLHSPLVRILPKSSHSFAATISATSRAPSQSWQCPCLRRSMATVATSPPVMQSPTSSKGPTALVFMNMGGPSTTKEVGPFLSRLFASPPLSFLSQHMQWPTFVSWALLTSSAPGRCRPNPPRSPPTLSWPPHCRSPHPKNPETVLRHWRWLTDPEMVKAAS